jgi:hypothetical protein
MVTDTEKQESIVETLYRMVTVNRTPPRAGQRMLRGWLREKVERNPGLLAAAGIPEEAAMKIWNEVYLVWRWKGAKQPTYENMPEDGWSLEKHIDMLCKALEAYGRSRDGVELGESQML